MTLEEFYRKHPPQEGMIRAKAEKLAALGNTEKLIDLGVWDPSQPVTPRVFYGEGASKRKAQDTINKWLEGAGTRQEFSPEGVPLVPAYLKPRDTDSQGILREKASFLESFKVSMHRFLDENSVPGATSKEVRDVWEVLISDVSKNFPQDPERGLLKFFSLLEEGKKKEALSTFEISKGDWEGYLSLVGKGSLEDLEDFAKHRVQMKDLLKEWEELTNHLSRLKKLQKSGGFAFLPGKPLSERVAEVGTKLEQKEAAVYNLKRNLKMKQAWKLRKKRLVLYKTPLEKAGMTTRKQQKFYVTNLISLNTKGKVSKEGKEKFLNFSTRILNGESFVVRDVPNDEYNLRSLKELTFDNGDHIFFYKSKTKKVWVPTPGFASNTDGSPWIVKWSVGGESPKEHGYFAEGFQRVGKAFDEGKVTSGIPVKDGEWKINAPWKHPEQMDDRGRELLDKAKRYATLVEEDARILSKAELLERKRLKKTLEREGVPSSFINKHRQIIFEYGMRIKAAKGVFEKAVGEVNRLEKVNASPAELKKARAARTKAKTKYDKEAQKAFEEKRARQEALQTGTTPEEAYKALEGKGLEGAGKGASKDIEELTNLEHLIEANPYDTKIVQDSLAEIEEILGRLKDAGIPHAFIDAHRRIAVKTGEAIYKIKAKWAKRRSELLEGVTDPAERKEIIEKVKALEAGNIKKALRAGKINHIKTTERFDGVPPIFRNLEDLDMFGAEGVEQLRRALQLYRANPESEVNKAHLEYLYYKLVHEALPEGNTKRMFERFEDIQEPNGLISWEDVDADEMAAIKEWRKTNAINARRKAESIATDIERWGLDDISDDSALLEVAKERGVRLTSKVVSALDVIIGMRTGGLLSSIGIPSMAITSGAINSILMPIEKLIGGGILRALRALGRSFSADPHYPDAKRRLYAPGNMTPSAVKEQFASAYNNIMDLFTGGAWSAKKKNPDMDVSRWWGFWSGSSPSTVDPAFAKKSETALGSGAREGFDPVVGYNPAGLSRTMAKAHSIEDPIGRQAAIMAVNIAEFISRKGLGAVDEVIKSLSLKPEIRNQVWSQIYTLLAPGKTLPNEEILSDIANKIADYLASGLTPQQTYQALKDDKELHKQLGAVMEAISRAGEADGGVPSPGQIDAIGKQLEEAGKAAMRGQFQAGFTDIFDEKRFVERLTDILYQSKQQVRKVTIQQDPPEGARKLVELFQQSRLGMFISPFTRATVNVMGMGMERIPLVNLIFSREREALMGMKGDIEQARSIGKMAVGSLAVYSGYALWGNPEEEDIHMNVEDKGKWREYTLSIPLTEESEGKLAEAISLYYANNHDIIHQELRNAGISESEESAVQFIRDQLPPIDSGGARYEIKLDRMAPYGALMNLGAQFAEFSQGREGLSTEEELLDPRNATLSVLDGVSHYVMDNGYMNSLRMITDLFSGDSTRMDLFVYNSMAQFASPGTYGLGRTAGELGTPTWTPNKYEEASEKAFFSTIAGGLLPGIKEDEELMKKRTAFGRVITKAGRLAFAVGDTVEVDSVEKEFSILGTFKRIPHPTRVPYMEGVDLRRFTMKNSEGVNAFEDHLILTGSLPMGRDAISSHTRTMNYFKTEEYKLLRKDIVAGQDPSIHDLSPEEQAKIVRKSSNAWGIVNKQVNAFLRGGRGNASRVLIEERGDLYRDAEGRSLASVLGMRKAAQKEGAKEQVDVLKQLGGN
jgi:hypothetical protein